MEALTERQLLEQQFNRLNISEHDFSAAHSYLEHYDPFSAISLQEAIASAAVVAYARPFTSNRPGIEKLSTSKVPIDVTTLFDEKKLAMHETIIRLRDQGVAHSDYDLKPTKRLHGPGGGAMSASKLFSPLQGLDIPMFKVMAWDLKIRCTVLILNINRQIEELVDDSEQEPGPIIASDGHDVVLRVPLTKFLPDK
jgi:hypothetical protein